MEAGALFDTPLIKQCGKHAGEENHGANVGDDAGWARTDGGCGKCEEDMMRSKVGFCAHRQDEEYFSVASSQTARPARVFWIGGEDEDKYVSKNVGIRVQGGADAEYGAEHHHTTRPQANWIDEEDNCTAENVGIRVEKDCDAPCPQDDWIDEAENCAAENMGFMVEEGHDASRPQNNWIDEEENCAAENVGIRLEKGCDAPRPLDDWIDEAENCAAENVGIMVEEGHDASCPQNNWIDEEENCAAENVGIRLKEEDHDASRPQDGWIDEEEKCIAESVGIMVEDGHGVSRPQDDWIDKRKNCEAENAGVRTGEGDHKASRPQDDWIDQEKNLVTENDGIRVGQGEHAEYAAEPRDASSSQDNCVREEDNCAAKNDKIRVEKCEYAEDVAEPDDASSPHDNSVHEEDNCVAENDGFRVEKGEYAMDVAEPDDASSPHDNSVHEEDHCVAENDGIRVEKGEYAEDVAEPDDASSPHDNSVHEEDNCVAENDGIRAGKGHHAEDVAEPDDASPPHDNSVHEEDNCVAENVGIRAGEGEHAEDVAEPDDASPPQDNSVHKEDHCVAENDGIMVEKEDDAECVAEPDSASPLNDDCADEEDNCATEKDGTTCKGGEYAECVAKHHDTSHPQHDNVMGDEGQKTVTEHVGVGGEGREHTERITQNHKHVCRHDDWINKNYDTYVPEHVCIGGEQGKDTLCVTARDNDPRLPQKFCLGEDKENVIPHNVGVGVARGDYTDGAVEHHDDLCPPQDAYGGECEKKCVAHNVGIGVEEHKKARRVTENCTDSCPQEYWIGEDEETYVPRNIARGAGEETCVPQNIARGGGEEGENTKHVGDARSPQVFWIGEDDDMHGPHTVGRAGQDGDNAACAAKTPEDDHPPHTRREGDDDTCGAHHAEWCGDHRENATKHVLENPTHARAPCSGVSDVCSKARDTLENLERQVAHLRQTFDKHKRERHAARSVHHHSNDVAWRQSNEGPPLCCRGASPPAEAQTLPLPVWRSCAAKKEVCMGKHEDGNEGREGCVLADTSAETWMREFIATECGRAERELAEREMRATAWTTTGIMSDDQCVNMSVENDSDTGVVNRLSTLTIDRMDTEIFALHERLVTANSWRAALEKHVRLLVAERQVARKPTPVTPAHCLQSDHDRCPSHVPTDYNPNPNANPNAKNVNNSTSVHIQDSPVSNSLMVDQSNVYNHSIVRQCSNDVARLDALAPPLTPEVHMHEETNGAAGAFGHTIASRRGDDFSVACTQKSPHKTIGSYNRNGEKKHDNNSECSNSIIRRDNDFTCARAPDTPLTTRDDDSTHDDERGNSLSVLATASSAKAQATIFPCARVPEAPLNDEGDRASVVASCDAPPVCRARNVFGVPDNTPRDTRRMDIQYPDSRLMPPRIQVYPQSSASLRAAVKKIALPTPRAVSATKNEDAKDVLTGLNVATTKAPAPAPLTTSGRIPHAHARDTPRDEEGLNSSTTSVNGAPVTHFNSIVSGRALCNDVPCSKLRPRRKWVYQRAPATPFSSTRKKTCALKASSCTTTTHEHATEARVVSHVRSATPIVSVSADRSTHGAVEKTISLTPATVSTTDRVMSPARGRSRLARSPSEARTLVQDVHAHMHAENAARRTNSPPTRGTSTFPVIEEERELFLEEEPRAVVLPNIDIDLMLNPTNFDVRIGENCAQKSDTANATLTERSDARRNEGVERKEGLNVEVSCGAHKRSAPSFCGNTRKTREECERDVLVERNERLTVGAPWGTRETTVSSLCESNSRSRQERERGVVVERKGGMNVTVPWGPRTSNVLSLCGNNTRSRHERNRGVVGERKEMVNVRAPSGPCLSNVSSLCGSNTRSHQKREHGVVVREINHRVEGVRRVRFGNPPVCRPMSVLCKDESKLRAPNREVRRCRS